MWVDTKGEDGPQCIHHTPVGALMAQPPPSRSCRSLQCAIKNAHPLELGVAAMNTMNLHARHSRTFCSVHS